MSTRAYKKGGKRRALVSTVRRATRRRVLAAPKTRAKEAATRAEPTDKAVRLSDECYTPGDELARARDVLGRIDLDPCSCSAANLIVRARRYFTVDDDGLSKRWRGVLWINNPYSRPTPWALKLIASYNSGDVTAALLLCNARTGAKWYHELAQQFWRCERRKRIRFWGPGTRGGAGNGRMDSAYFYVGDNVARFIAVYGDVGRIVPPVSVTKAVTGASRPSSGSCTVCSRSLAGRRADADTCSSRCRQTRYYRKKVAAKSARRARTFQRAS